MNNFRLLTGVLAVTFSLTAVQAYDENRVVALEEIFSSAETNSLQLRPSFAAQTEADRAINEARSARLPDISSSLYVGYIGDGFTTRRDFSDRQKAEIPHLLDGFAVNIEQPLYAGGAITAGIKLAELKKEAALSATDLRRDELRLRLTGFYLDLYKYSNLRKVVTDNIASARKMLGEMQARYEQGLVLLNDITRYELLVSNLELQLVKIDNTLSILNDNLVVTAGLGPDLTIVPDSTILERALPGGDESFWQHEAAVSSPSIRLADLQVEMSRKGETLAKSERLPKIGLKTGWQIDGPILVEVPPINRNLSYWSVGLGISYNISSLYKDNRSVARSKAATAKALDEAAALRENVSLAVRSDYIRYLEAYEELKSCSKSEELALQNYRTVSTRYAEGMAIITDMLDAADARFEASTRLVNARISIIQNYYTLLFTTGKI